LILIATFGQAQPTDEQQIREAWQRHNQAIEHHDTVAIANFGLRTFTLSLRATWKPEAASKTANFFRASSKPKKMCAHTQSC
jgi:hypothetical protein